MIVHKKLFTRVNYFHLEAADGFYPMQTRTSQKSSFLDTVHTLTHCATSAASAGHFEATSVPKQACFEGFYSRKHAQN